MNFRIFNLNSSIFALGFFFFYLICHFGLPRGGSIALILPYYWNGGVSIFFQIFSWTIVHVHWDSFMKKIVKASSTSEEKVRQEPLLPETKWILSHLNFKAMQKKSLEKLIRKFQMTNSPAIRDNTPAVSRENSVESKKKLVSIWSYMYELNPNLIFNSSSTPWNTLTLYQIHYFGTAMQCSTPILWLVNQLGDW